MKRKSIQSLLLVVLWVGLISMSGCATPQNPYTYQGAGLGAAVGAAIGAGTNGKNPWKGAAIGGLLGGAAGAVGGEIYGRNNPYCPPNCPPQQGYYQSGPQPGYGYPANPNNNRGYYGQSYGQSAPPSNSPGYYSQEGSPTPYGASQSSDPSYRYAY
jgi:hypothetical protein